MDQADIIWPRDALPKGTELNGYRIEAVIGRGGFGITYRATDAIDQNFAIKECFPKQFAVRQGNEVFPSDQDSTEPFAECLSRFGGEARALRQLATIGAAGDGVVKVSTFFPANGTAYVIMELLDGDSLDRVIKSQKSGLAQAQLDFIVPRLLHATSCVHSAGLLHRDIKPANIILREDGRPVLIDFGAARTTSNGRTITFTQIFSEGYAPIEQFAGTRQGPFSDVYALGATLYRAIGGTAVDSFTRHQAILRGQRDPQPTAVQVGGSRYDPNLLTAIDAAMVVAPEDRPQSVAALLALLNAQPESDPTIAMSRAGASPVTPLADSHAHTADRTDRPSANSLAERTLLARVDDARRDRARANTESGRVWVEHTSAPDDRPRRARSFWAAIASVSLILVAVTGGVFSVTSSLPGIAPKSAKLPSETPGSPPPQPPTGQPAADTPKPPAPHDSAEKLRITALAGQAAKSRTDARIIAERARSTMASLALPFGSIFADADMAMGQAEEDFNAGSFAQAKEGFAKASSAFASAARQYLNDQSAADARVAQSRMRAGNLQGAESALSRAKQIKLAMLAFPAAETVAPASDASNVAAQKANDAASAAHALRDRVTSTITSLGLNAEAVLANVDSVLDQAQSELSSNQYESATTDFTKATSVMSTATLNYLDLQSAAYAGISQQKMHIGDLKGAQSALDLAKRIRAARASFQ